MRLVFRLTALLLAGTALLSACSGPKAQPAPRDAPARGRFLETELEAPAELLRALCLREAGGEVELTGWTGLGAQGGTGLGCWRLRDGAFVREDPPWLAALVADGWSTDALAFGPEGNPWAVQNRYGDNSMETRVLRLGADGAWETLPLGEADAPSGYLLALAEDGSYLLGSTQIAYRYGPDSTALEPVSAYVQQAVASGEWYVIANGATDAVEWYAPSGGGAAVSVAWPLSRRGSVSLTPDGSGGVLLCDETGLTRLSPDGSEPERLIDGSLCSLSAASTRPEQILAGADGSYTVLLSPARWPEESRLTLLRFAWSADAPAEPSQTLRVCSLYAKDSLRQAAVELQKRLPDVRVELDLALDGGGDAQTAQDAVRALNTALLAGDGADVYLLDGLPWRSYQEKGVLRDLGDLPALADCYQNITSALETENGLYAVPTRFSLPVLFAPDGCAEGAEDLADLAAEAQKPGSLPLFYGADAQGLTALFLPVCLPAWQRPDGALDEAGLSAFLESVKKLAEVTPVLESPYSPHFTAEDLSFGGFLLGRGGAFARRLDSARILAEGMSALGGEQGEGHGTMRPLPGQKPDVFLPSEIVGVRAGSAQPELAAQFASELLGARAQAVEGRGLPVRRETLEEQIARQREADPAAAAMIGMTLEEGPDGTALLVLDQAPDDAMEGVFWSLVAGAKTPYLSDATLEQMIAEETEAFFDGGLSAAGAAAAVAARTRAYLSE